MLFSLNNLFDLNEALCYDQIIYNNTVYKTNDTLTSLFYNNLLLYNLKKIVYFDENVLFLSNIINILSYNKHIVSYTVSNVDTDLNVLKNIDYFMGTVNRLKH